MTPTPISNNYKELIALYDATLKRLTTPYQTQFIDTSYGKTHVLSAGTEHAPPILLLHGAASNAIGCWPLINGLASKYRVYAPDAPRQLGKTETFPLSSKNTAYQKWLVKILDNLNIKQTNIVGFSFGGWMACKLAIHVPARIAKLVLLSPVGVAPFRIQYWLKAPALLLLMLITKSDSSIHKFAKLFAGPTASEEIIEEIAVPTKVFLKNFHMQDTPHRLANKDLKKIVAPTMLLVGQQDTICNPKTIVSRIQKNIPKIQTEIIANLGHVVYFEKPELINAQILKFFESGSD